jgi:hypothetical protein
VRRREKRSPGRVRGCKRESEGAGLDMRPESSLWPLRRFGPSPDHSLQGNDVIVRQMMPLA